MAFVQVPCVPDGNVAQVEYDSEAQTLQLTFVRGGRQGQYFGVPEKEIEGFSTSGLTAWRYWRSVGLNRYPYQEI